MIKIFTDVIKNVLQSMFPGSFVLGTIKSLKGIVLTFDDGPHPVHTPIILKELQRRHIKAVFFVTGKELERLPELGKKIVEEGHLLGNHTYDHLSVKECSFEEYKISIEKADDLLESITPDPCPKLFRPPYSDFSVKQLIYILFSSYTLFNWTKDSKDSFILSSRELLEYNKRLPLAPGDVLLLHEDYQQTVSALPGILDYLLSQGHSFVLPILK